MTERSSKTLAALLDQPTEELLAELDRIRRRLVEWSRQQTVGATDPTDPEIPTSLDAQGPTQNPQPIEQSIDSDIPLDQEESANLTEQPATP